MFFSSTLSTIPYAFTHSLCFLSIFRTIIKALGGHGFLCVVLDILSLPSRNMMQVLTSNLVNNLFNEKANSK